MKKILGLFAVFLVAGWANFAQAGIITTTLYFSGLCQDCGNEQVTGSLELFGDDVLDQVSLAPVNFVSFTYDGSSLIPGGFTVQTQQFDDPNVNQLFAAFNPDGSLLSSYFSLEWNANVLGGPDGCGSICSFYVANAVISPDRYWSLGLGSGPDDYGINGQFSVTNPNPVPAPATLVLFGLGLAGLRWSRRKKV